MALDNQLRIAVTSKSRVAVKKGQNKHGKNFENIKSCD